MKSYDSKIACKTNGKAFYYANHYCPTIIIPNPTDNTT
jgi:hypothetical protein